jgi:ADP-ribose pyrophosphatase
VVTLDVDRVRFPDGSTGELEIVRHRGAVAVLPLAGSLDEPNPEIVLLKQYRYAVEGDLYEIPAGGRDEADESWEACARRELEEETGLRSGRLISLTHVYTTPGFSDEFVEIVRISLSEALDWVRAGIIIDGKTITTLLFAERFILRHR